MSETTPRIKGSVSGKDIKTAKWLINECPRVYDAMDDRERELFNRILDWFGGMLNV